MGRPLSDDEMSQLEAQHAQTKSKPLSDAEMANLEAQHSTGSGISGPNPELNSQTAMQAAGDVVKRTPQGARTFLPQQSPDVVEGVAPLAVPVAGAATAGIKGLGALSDFLGSNAAARIGANTVAGAAQEPDNRLWGAAKGAAIGAGSEGLAKLIGGASGAFSRPKEILKYAKDPVAAQDAASGAISDATDALKKSYQERVDPKLEQMTYKLDPRKYQGSVPEADDIIRKATVNQAYPGLPDSIDVNGKDGEALRRALDAQVNYPRGTSVAIPKEVADKYATNKALADNIRSQRNLGADSDLADMYSEWSKRLGQADDLSRKSGNPISGITGQRGDDIALRMKIDQATGSNLNDLGSKLGSAEKLRKGAGIAGTAGELAKQSAKGAWESGKNASGAGLEAFIQSLMAKDKRTSQDSQ